jgi:hypothetical protein
VKIEFDCVNHLERGDFDGDHNRSGNGGKDILLVERDSCMFLEAWSERGLLRGRKPDIQKRTP